ncbi:MAG TPA: hypothetical protein VKP65_16335 [Rhodothermales bacterium]|nr:hypothetical protein [Rhodothermales bacterium]
MGKLILFLVGAIIFAGVYYSTGEKGAQYDTAAKMAADEFEVLARNAALTGLSRAEQQLADNFDNKATVTGTYEGAAYTTKIVAKGSAGVIINSSASITPRSGETVTYDVRAEYERENWFRIADAPPPFMQYLLMAGGDVELSGDVNGQMYEPPDGSSAPTNVDIHSNEDLTLKGKSVRIEGFGTYSSEMDAKDSHVEATFIPNSNPTGSSATYQVSQVTIPTLDPGLMALAMAVDSTTSSDVKIISQDDLPARIGTRDNPYIWHIKGDLKFEADIEIPGYTIFLVEDKLEIKKSLTTPQTSYEGADESTVAFYVGDVAKIAGESEIWAQIFANDLDIDLKGTVEVYGSLVTHGDVDLGGTVDYYYRGASPALTTYFNGSTNDRLVRVAYSEW